MGTLFATLLVLVMVFLVVYLLVPELLVHAGHLDAVARVPGVEEGIALTFDDGPGESTAEVLDVLAEVGAKATFFLVAERARRSPELVRRILAEGHEVGVHGLRHVSFLALGPSAAARQIAQGAEEILRLTGHRVRLFRPPWGHMNAAAWRTARRLRLRLVFWSVNAGDWVPWRSPDRIAAAIRSAEPGDIVLLHDAGGDGRARTVAALRRALPEMKRRGQRFLTVTELLAAAGGRRGVVYRAWEAWEALFGRLWGAIELGPEDLLRLTRGVYRGPELIGPAGERLRPGDTYFEVHFKNRELSEAGPIRGAKLMRTSLQHLAEFVAERPEAAGIEFLMGITVLSRPVELFGFHVVDLPGGIGSWWAGVYRRTLLRIYHPAGGRRLEEAHQELRPRLAYITRRELLERYGGGTAERRRRG
jgi:peptidoglycan/xylan/chitin deacetylase (PgdA/CDA1 family)